MPLITYVLLFKARRDRAAVPLLARCLRGLPESERVASLTPFAPFCYILDALKELSNGAIEIPVPAEAFAARARIADRAERWYGQHRQVPRGEGGRAGLPSPAAVRRTRTPETLGPTACP
jgi:hypothetical protein